MSSYSCSSPGPNILLCPDERLPELCPPCNINQEVCTRVDGQGEVTNSIQFVDD